MTNIINFSKRFLISGGLILVIGVVTILSAPEAKAYQAPNVLVGGDYTIGSTGQGVVVLQGLMSELGYLKVPVNIPLGYYGSLTRSAVARYQSDRYVSPPVGYFGPITKNTMHNEFATKGWLTLLGW